MHLKYVLIAFSVALAVLTGAASAVEITYDTTDIPNSPAATATYTVPITISGDDIGVYKFKVTYDKEATEVTFSKTGNATPGGREGVLTVVGTSSDNLEIKISPKSSGVVTMELSEVLDDEGNALSVSNPSCVLDLEVSKAPVKETAKPTPTTAATPVRISFDTSDIPSSPVADEKYIVPVTISGDRVAHFSFKVTYDQDAASVTLGDTGNAFVSSGRGIAGLDGNEEMTFNVVITPFSSTTVKMEFSDIEDENSKPITPTGSKSKEISFKFKTATQVPEETEKPVSAVIETEKPIESFETPNEIKDESDLPEQVLSLPSNEDDTDNKEISGNEEVTETQPAKPASSGTEEKKGIPGLGFSGLAILAGCLAIAGNGFSRRKL